MNSYSLTWARSCAVLWRTGKPLRRAGLLGLLLAVGTMVAAGAEDAAAAKVLSHAQAEEQLGAVQDRLEPALKALKGTSRRAQVPLLTELRDALAKLAPQLPKKSSLRDQHSQLTATVLFVLDLLDLDTGLEANTDAAALQGVKAKLAALEGRKTPADAAVKELLGNVRERLNAKLRALTEKQKFAASIPELEAKVAAAATISDLDALVNGPLRVLVNDSNYAREFAPQLDQVRARIDEKKGQLEFADRVQALTRQAGDCHDSAALAVFEQKFQELCRDPRATTAPFAARVGDVRDRLIPAIRSRLEQEESAKLEQQLARVAKAIGEVDRLLVSSARGSSARLGTRHQVWLCNSQNERLDQQLPSIRTKYEDASLQLREFVRQNPSWAAGEQPLSDLLVKCAATLAELEGYAAYVKRANALIELAREQPEGRDQRSGWVSEFESFRTSRDSRGNRLWESLLASDARKCITELAKDMLRPVGADGLREVLANCTRGLDSGKKISREEAKALKQMVREKAGRFGWSDTPPAKPDATRQDRDMVEYSRKLEQWQKLNAQVTDSLRKIDSCTRGGGFNCCG